MSRAAVMTMLRRILLVVVLVVVGLYLLLVAVATEPPHFPGVSNGTEQPIDVYLVGAGEQGGDRFLFTLPPASGATFTFGPEGYCTGQDLVALGPAGNEIERRGPGLCMEEVWRVNGDEGD